MKKLNIASLLMRINNFVMVVFIVESFYWAFMSSREQWEAIIHLVVSSLALLTLSVRFLFAQERCMACKKWIHYTQFLKMKTYQCPHCGNTEMRPWPWEK